MAVRPQPGNRLAGAKVSKVDRDDSKRNVAINKKEQQADMARQKARKAFAALQKDIEKDRAAALKIKATIEAMVKKVKDDRQLDQRFMGQVTKQVKSLVQLDKMLKALPKETAEVMEQPKLYAQVVADAGRMPPVSRVQTYGDMVTVLAMLLVILNRVLQLKPKK